MSGDGSRIIVGARYNDGNGSDAGHARIYTFIFTPSFSPSVSPSVSPSLSFEPSTAPSISPSLSSAPSYAPTIFCESGHYLNETDDRCKPCLQGTFSATGGRNLNCILCSKGEYQNQTGQSTCNECEKGTFQELTGEKKCKVCPKGGYCPNVTDKDGGFKQCPIGKINNVKGKHEKASCEPCPSGKYPDPLSKTCLPCPLTLGSDGTSAGCPFCAEGFYLNDTNVTSEQIKEDPAKFAEFCLPCPLHAQCDKNMTI